MALLSYGHARWSDKVKPLHLHYNNAYGHQSWQDRDLPWATPTLKLFKPLATWFCKIPWQTKTTIFPLLQSLWSPNLTGWWLTFKDSYHMTYHIIWLLSCLIISTPIISYDSYHMSHTTFNQVVLLNHLSIWKIYISTVTRFIATKLGKVLTLGRRFSMQMLKSLTTSCFFVILPDGV